MTKIEYGKCEKLMEEAIRKAKQSAEEYKTYNQLLNEDTIKGRDRAEEGGSALWRSHRNKSGTCCTRL